MPGDLFSGFQQFALEFEHADEPLLGHDVFHGRVAALVDSHRLRDVLLAQQEAAFFQRLDDLLSSLA